MSKIMKIIVTASVLLNLVFISIGAGVVMKSVSHKPWKEMREDLTPEARTALKQHSKTTRADIRPVVEQAKVLQKDLVKILNQEEFDRAAFDAKSSELGDIMGQMSQHKMTSMGDLAESLSYDDRKIMVQKFEKMLSRGMKPRGGKRGDAKRGDRKNHERRDQAERLPRPSE